MASSPIAPDLRYEDILEADAKDMFGPADVLLRDTVVPKPIHRLRHVQQRLRSRTYDVSPKARAHEIESLRMWRERATRPRPDLPSGPELLNEWSSKLVESSKSLVASLERIDKLDAPCKRSPEVVGQRDHAKKEEAIEPKVVSSGFSLPHHPKRVEYCDAEGHAEMSACSGHNIAAAPTEEEPDDPFYAPIDFSNIQDPFPELGKHNFRNRFYRSASDPALATVSGSAQQAFASAPAFRGQTSPRTPRLRGSIGSQSPRSPYNMNSSKKECPKCSFLERMALIPLDLASLQAKGVRTIDSPVDY